MFKWFKKNKNEKENKNISISNKRGFEAAKSNNSNILWGSVTNIEDSEIYRDLNSLRARSRDLVKNDDLMKRYITLLVSNVVGIDGFKLQLKSNKVDKKNLAIIKAVQDAWEDWSKSVNCDITEKNSLKDICEINVKTIAQDGEFLVRMIKEKSNEDNKYGFKLQLLDVERLDISLNKQLDNGNYIKMGIEFNKYSKPINYYIKKDISKSVYNSTYSFNDYDIVSSKDLLHVFKQESPEQSRGFPWAHAVILSIKNLKEFSNACVLAAKVGAASSIYLEKTNSVKTSDTADYQDAEGNYITEMGVGEIRVLPSGFSMKSFNGNFPSETYAMHTKRQIQRIAGGLGLSSIYLGNNTEDLNFSSARTVLLEEQNKYRSDQQLIINKFLNVIFKEWLFQAILNNKIVYNKTKFNKETLSFDDMESIDHKFIGRKWQAIDPLKEAEANELEYKTMLKPKSTIAAEKGLDYSELLEQYNQDFELEKSILKDNFQFLTSDKESINIKKEDVDKKEKVENE